MSVTEQLVKPSSTLKEAAARIVNECLQVKTDEQVTIFTFDHTLGYAKDLALEVENANGVSVTIVQTNDFYWSLLKDVAESQFARRQKGLLALIDQTDAIIGLGGPKDPSHFATVPSERIAKFIQGFREMQDKTVERKIRTINLLVGFVTEERAKTYGFDFNRWTRVVNDSLNVDHAEISRVAGRLAPMIEKGTNARITSPSGTDLRFNFKGRPAHVHDGILDKSDLERGTLAETLPAGAIENAPDEDSANGTLVYDLPNALQGKMLRGLRFEFKNGRVVKYSAEQNQEVFGTGFDTATGDKDRFANVVIGLNPRAEHIGIFTDRIVKGAVSVSIGNNSGIGGDNKDVFGYQGSMAKATLEIDGKRLVQDGRLIV